MGLKQKETCPGRRGQSLGHSKRRPLLATRRAVRKWQAGFGEGTESRAADGRTAAVEGMKYYKTWALL